jgi:hypothetical protein
MEKPEGASSVDGQTFQVGANTVIQSDAPGRSCAVVFEDDGETAYFYALDLKHAQDPILDAVHIYTVANVTDRYTSSKLSILWSDDASKCALLINGYPHAAFDFAARRGFCRTNFPNSPNPAECSLANLGPRMVRRCCCVAVARTQAVNPHAFASRFDN